VSAPTAAPAATCMATIIEEGLTKQ
jgi:hypothetical protein